MFRVVVLRRGEDFFRAPMLDDPAFGHHVDAVGHLAHDAEIMRDEKKGHAHLALELGKKFEDLRLHGHVESGGRLVRDQEIGLVRQRHGDDDALALAARKLMRIGAETCLRIRNADALQKVEHARLDGGPAHSLVLDQHFADLPLDRVQRVERGERLLKDHGDLVAADLAHRLLVRADEVLSFEKDFTRGVEGLRIGEKLHDGKRGNGLAGTGLADKRHGLAGHDVEGDLVDGDRLLPVHAEADGEVLHGDEGSAHRSTFLGSKASRTASPMKMRRLSMIAMAKKPVKPSHGACRLALPC